MLPSQIISQTYTGTTTQSGDPYEVTKNPIPQTPHSKELHIPWHLGDKRQGKSRSVCQLSSWCILSTWSGDSPGHRTELDKLVHPPNPPAFTTHQLTQVHPQATILLPLDGVTWNMIWGLLKKLSSKFNSHYNIKITTGTVHANQFIVLIISQSVLFRMQMFQP